MVEDAQIKTTVSPFAIREGEIKTFDGKDGYVSINQIIHKMNLGHITDIHLRILDLINEFCSFKAFSKGKCFREDICLKACFI